MKQRFYIKKKSFFKIQIKEYSILFIMINYLDVISGQIEELSEFKLGLMKMKI